MKEGKERAIVRLNSSSDILSRSLNKAMKSTCRRYFFNLSRCPMILSLSPAVVWESLRPDANKASFAVSFDFTYSENTDHAYTPVHPICVVQVHTLIQLYEANVPLLNRLYARL
jgi:hypothetical protein